MACTGITEHGAANASPEEYEVKKIALEQSHIHCLLLDHSKFDRSALMVYAPISGFQHIFTDEQPPEKYRTLFVQYKVCVSTVSKVDLDRGNG